MSEPVALSRRELARLITGIENGDAAALQRAKALHASAGGASIVGITGAPGTGKSTLVAALTKEARIRNRTVAILSIDPSSPFSGGAILGDRIRMRELSGDAGVFIRSMANRGAKGGLAHAAADVSAVLAAAGYHYIFLETVGAGQAEVDVARVADTVVVVEAPGMGDDVQAIKAGILEIADILVVNKADRDGADATVAALKAALELGEATSGHHGLSLPTAIHANDSSRRMPLIKTVATKGQGIAELLNAIEQHSTQMLQNAELRRQRAEAEIMLRLGQLLMAEGERRLDRDALLRWATACAAHEAHPDDAARDLLRSILPDTL
jgi:LAO/AO transport system kinase